MSPRAIRYPQKSKGVKRAIQEGRLKAPLCPSPFEQGHIPWNKGRVGVYSQGTLTLMSKRALEPHRVQTAIVNLPKELGDDKNPFYGWHHTEETKRKLRERVYPPEFGEKISRAKKGKSFYHPPQTPETRKKISCANKGKHNCPRTEFVKGQVAINKGKVMPPDFGQKLSAVFKNQYLHGRVPWNKGIKWEQPWNKDPARKAQRIANSIKGNFKRPTSPERKVIGIIEKYALPYKYTGDGTFIIGGLNPDFVNINGEKIALDVFGDYWHTIKADRESYTQEGRRNILAKYGWQLIVLWEKDINSLPEGKIVDILEAKESKI